MTVFCNRWLQEEKRYAREAGSGLQMTERRNPTMMKLLIAVFTLIGENAAMNDRVL